MLSALRLLQLAHKGCRFSVVLGPPLDFGTMWSLVMRTSWPSALVA